MTTGPPEARQHHQQRTTSLHQRQPQQRAGMEAPPPGAPSYGYPGQVAPGMAVEGPRLPPSLPLIVLDATTAKLMVPSREALTALLVVPLMLWATVVLVGVAHAEPLPEGTTKRDFEHPLTWFDRQVFRVWGPLLPLAPYLVRVAALGLRASAKTPGRPLRPGVSLPLPALLTYCVVIFVRIALYVSHLAFQQSTPMVLVSDHLLLAASVVACFQSELLLCLSDVFKAELLRGLDKGAGIRQIVVVAAMVTSMFLLVFVYGDMYCTARWYHEPAETLGALATGALVFQVPVVVWLLRRANRGPGRV